MNENIKGFKTTALCPVAASSHPIRDLFPLIRSAIQASWQAGWKGVMAATWMGGDKGQSSARTTQ